MTDPQELLPVTQEDKELIAELIRVGEFWPGHEKAQAMREVAARHRHESQAELVGMLAEARAGLQAMMDAWLDYHDAHSLTEPVTGAAGNAFDKALDARDRADALLARLEGSTP